MPVCTHTHTHTTRVHACVSAQTHLSNFVLDYVENPPEAEGLTSSFAIKKTTTTTTTENL